MMMTGTQSMMTARKGIVHTSSHGMIIRVECWFSVLLVLAMVLYLSLGIFSLCIDWLCLFWKNNNHGMPNS